MTTDWRSLCGGPRLEFADDYVTVTFEGGRRHRVRVTETADTFELHAIVARSSAIAEVHGQPLPVRVWGHNRAAQLVSFRVDTRGRVCAVGWVAKAGLTAEEFQLVLRRVAAESDRFEFLLTGKDVE
jgi:hypothetical protein